MARQLAALGPAKSDREAKRNIVAAVKETARMLGNRPATCRNYYVHPAVFESYMEQTIFVALQSEGLDQALSKKHLRSEEIAVLNLVESYDGAGKESAVIKRFFRSRRKAS